MNKSAQKMTRYLLGELSDSEQAALEEKYFTDPQVFDKMVKAENELVDNYGRGLLSPQSREKFEQYYQNQAIARGIGSNSGSQRSAATTRQ